jgi:DNA-directed RNA polymerase subunit M
MDFCPECGSRLVPKKTDSKVSIACSKCSYVRDDAACKKAEVKAGAKVIKHDLHQQMTVISKEDHVNTMPTMRMECPKCRNMLVYVWQVQTRGGDEASTQFFRCTKCNHTFREYS